LGSSLFWGVAQRRLVVCTDVSGQPIGPIFKGQVVEETSVTKYQSTLCNNIPEERISYLQHGGNLKLFPFILSFSRPGWKIISEPMIGYVVVSEVDTLMYVALSNAEKEVSYGELVGTTERIMLCARCRTNPCRYIVVQPTYIHTYIMFVYICTECRTVFVEVHSHSGTWMPHARVYEAEGPKSPSQHIFCHFFFFTQTEHYPLFGRIRTYWQDFTFVRIRFVVASLVGYFKTCLHEYTEK
jgi:hypothetical protein